MDDFNKRWDNFAVYLPSIQKSYAKVAIKADDKTRTMPKDVTMRSLNFINPKNKLWHYKYALYSAGQFKIGETQSDMVTTRDEKQTVILGDSGGFQIGKGTLAGFTALNKLKTADEVCEAWRNATQLKKWIVNWLETHSDYAMTLDMPLWAQLPQNKKTPFHKCSTQQLIDLTVENLEFIKRNKRGNTKWLNVIQGTNSKDMKQWWDAVKGYRFGGWALAGDTGWRGGSMAVVTQVLMMRDEGAFDKGMDWLHVLGVSQTKWAVILSAIQRGLRKSTNPNLRVSFDSASPNILAGKFEQLAVYPKFTNKEESWAISAVRCPKGEIYVNSGDEFAFPFPSALGDKLKLSHLNVKYDKYSSVNFDDVTQAFLTHHNTWVYVRAMLEANELAFLDKADAEQFVPKNLLACLHLIEELMCTKNWKARITSNKRLFDAVDKMSKDEVIIVK
ncbi:hypothetical protein [Polynucleobacter sp. MWH-Berg-3C6]|uniref:hypothetical protein n=1 Tax=Polynucleobacter sp. MWH-Berg-3C6 TaxID=1855882 RepID=UPI001C0BB040|nr:hypothetical protein [Polynucleobacter sp. MWH-Berg-3C6]MBU3551182.1 hypothetical protein [Polynucleobacter sp. MWH-Berg-3C6]